MRKQVFGRKFKRDANERKALLKGLMNDLVLKEGIKTTEEKAKSIKGQVEKLVTKAKLKGEAARMLLQPYLSPKAVEKVIKELAPRFANRPGGYTRIVKLGERFGDNASLAVIEWVEKTVVVETVGPAEEAVKSSKAEKPTKKETKKTEKKETKKEEKKSTKTAKK